MEVAIAASAARLAVGGTLGLVADKVLEKWAASANLGFNVRALTTDLQFAQCVLDKAKDWVDMTSPTLAQMLLDLRDLAYNADDVLDELEYFRIQDEIEGTHEAAGIGGLVVNARHTARAVASKLKFSSPSCATANHSDPGEEHTGATQGCLSVGGRKTRDGKPSLTPSPTNQAEHGAKAGCLSMFISSAHASTPVGKRFPSSSLPSEGADSDNISPKVGRRRFLCGASSSKAPKGESTVNAPKLKFNRAVMSNRMKGILEHLRPLCDKILQLLGPEHSRAQGVASDQPITTTSIIGHKLYERENQKKRVVDDIASGKYSENGLTVLPIVGLGGIGKTNFAQHIYKEVGSHFDFPIWVAVSQNFRANRLAQEIIKSTPKGEGEMEYDRDEVKIIKRLKHKKFLLVLDDVWTYQEDQWEQLLAPLRGGTNGNMIIVTTRIPGVAKSVGTADCLVRLERFNEEDSMHFFRHCVFGEKKSWETHPSLQKVGADIVKRLKGSPLAIKTVGRLLRNQYSLEHWTTILESNIWEQQKGPDDIMPALKLSYNFLPFELQPCFAHCALFPEDYKFSSKELINLWIGLGLLHTSQHSMRIEDIGWNNFNKLVDHGFFEKYEKQDACPYYIIHDLLHDLAVHVSSNECLSIHGCNWRPIHIPSSIRHLSIIIDNTDVMDIMTFKNRKRDLIELSKRLKAENLRTLMLFGEHHGNFIQIFGDMFKESKALRVVFLSGISYAVEDLLHNFSKLVHLRYLRIMGPQLCAASLPNSFSRLYNLMVLDVENCIDHFNPENCFEHCYEGKCTEHSCTHHSCIQIDLRKLVKIRHFLVPDDKPHANISKVGELKSLYELQRFEVKRETNGFGLDQLWQLQDLHGTLAIYQLEKVEATKEANESNLVQMNHLRKLILDWTISRSNKDAKQEEDVLESLKPRTNLRELCIRGHGGGTFPTWLGESLSTRNLENLCLDHVEWKNITSQSFLNLKILELVCIPSLKKWQVNDNYNSFFNLEVLIIKECIELTEFPFSHFPRICKLYIGKCPELLTLPYIPSSQAMSYAEMWGVDALCGSLSLRYQKNHKTKELEIDMDDDDQEIVSWNMLDFNNLREIETLFINSCPPLPLDNMQMLLSLKILRIWNYHNIVLFPVKSKSNPHYQFLSVDELEICNCNASGNELTELISYFPNLSQLRLLDCDMIRWFAVVERHTTAVPGPSSSELVKTMDDAQTGHLQQEEIEAGMEGLLLLPSHILELKIKDCPDLRLCSNSLPIDGMTVKRGLLCLDSLRSLKIEGCPKFFSSSLSSPSYCPFPTSLQDLFLSDVEGIFTLTPLSNLTKLSISNCRDLRSEVLWPLLAQGQLVQLSISGCHNSFFDSEPSHEQNHLHSTRLQVLFTDGKSGVLTEPICAHFSSSLTKLYFTYKCDMEHFTKEQEEALQILISLQELSFMSCGKLQSLPAGLAGFRYLRILDISYCPAIRFWPKDGLPSSLTELRIRHCPCIRPLPEGNIPSSLQTLDVSFGNNGEDLKTQCRKLRGTIPIVKA